MQDIGCTGEEMLRSQTENFQVTQKLTPSTHKKLLPNHFIAETQFPITYPDKSPQTVINPVAMTCFS